MSKSFKDSYFDEIPTSRNRKREKEDWKTARQAKAARRNFEQALEEDH